MLLNDYLRQQSVQKLIQNTAYAHSRILDATVWNLDLGYVDSILPTAVCCASVFLACEINFDCPDILIPHFSRSRIPDSEDSGSDFETQILQLILKQTNLTSLWAKDGKIIMWETLERKTDRERMWMPLREVQHNMCVCVHLPLLMTHILMKNLILSRGFNTSG